MKMEMESIYSWEWEFYLLLTYVSYKSECKFYCLTGPAIAVFENRDIFDRQKLKEFIFTWKSFYV